MRAAAHDVAASVAAVDQARQLPNPELSYLREGMTPAAVPPPSN
ncbi:hypothetical protein [Pseudoduganella armeniaca]|nr:hypothetical protein [Pseudoduganella armeniaca]